MGLADFDINADGEDQGFDANPSQVLTFTLRTQPPHGIRSWRLQVFHAADFDLTQAIAVNPPRQSKGAPELTLVGATSGQNVAPVSLSGSITATMPGTRFHGWIVRSIINGGRDHNGKADSSLIRERMIVIRNDFGQRPVVVTETTQYESDGWAGALSDAIAGGGLVSSVFGRTGDIAAVAGDYDSDEINNASGVTGDDVSEALDTLDAKPGFRRIRTEIYRTDGSLQTIDADGNSVTTTSSTWAPQSDGELYRVWVVAGAPSGSRGPRVSAGNTSGGGGSGGSSLSEEFFDRNAIEAVIAALGTPIPIAVGAGGAAVAASSQSGGNANAVAGNPGAESSFGTLCVAYPGGVGATGAAGPNRGGGGGGIFNAGGTVNFLGGEPQDVLNASTSLDNTYGGGLGGSEGATAGAAVTGGGGGGASRTAATAANGLAGGRSIRGGGGSGASGGAQTAGAARAGAAGGKSGYSTGSGAISTAGAVGGGGTAGAVGTAGGKGADGIIGVRCGDGGGGGGGFLSTTGANTTGAGGEGGFPGGAGGPSGGGCANGGTISIGASGKGGDGVVAVFTYG